jgi:hypothetical protein
MGIVQALPCCEEKVMLVCIIAAPHSSQCSFWGNFAQFIEKRFNFNVVVSGSSHLSAPPAEVVEQQNATTGWKFGRHGTVP